jgi:murein L,D-transpeptidase YafK
MCKANIYQCAIILLTALALGGPACATERADQVVVSKSASRLYLQGNGKTFATFKVAFGAQPQGHKQQQGDERTPEGNYFLDAKNAQSAYYKSIHISYPNAADRAQAKSKGIDVGGDVMIHGQRNGWGWFAPLTQWFNWTDGCVALSNRDMEVVWRAVKVGTPITIYP